jgi:hypothetical protein
MMHCIRTRQKFGVSLLAASLLSGVFSGNSASAQVTLAEFKFDEGSGAVTKSLTNDLTGQSRTVTEQPGRQPHQHHRHPVRCRRATALCNWPMAPSSSSNDATSPLLATTTSADTRRLGEARQHLDRHLRGHHGLRRRLQAGLQASELIFTLFGVVDIPSGFVLTSDEWHHVAAVWEPGVGVTFYYDGASSFVEETPRRVNPYLNNILNLGAERLGTPITGIIDRLRIHGGVLTADQLDSVAATPKGPLANTLVAYSFNEAAMPYQSSATTPRPTISGADYLSQQLAPLWDTDSPSGGASDRSLNFTTGGMRVVVPDPNTAIRLENGDFTIQAWVKFGALPARSVLFFNNGPWRRRLVLHPQSQGLRHHPRHPRSTVGSRDPG